VNEVKVRVLADARSLGAAAAAQAAESLRDTLGKRGNARIIAATGASQFEFLEELTSLPDISWESVEMFHLDEYVGLPATHPASFQKYLKERLIQKTGLAKYHLLEGDHDPHRVIEAVGRELNSAPIDLAFVGIGENGHLAFNDPPADFDSDAPYLVVDLDQQCRQQQVDEGWFSALAEVPRQAISMSIRQILKAKEIIAVVGGKRKAQAVQACLDGPVSPMAPASILQTHANATIYLDRASAALLSSQLTR
jgi:glucosamine-6-phosphate deaminase